LINQCRALFNQSDLVTTQQSEMLDQRFWRG
jgi:hypothetical protein